MAHAVGTRIPRWTVVEDEVLRDLAGVVKYSVIADALERRTQNQVRARCQYLGIITRRSGYSDLTLERRKEYNRRWKYKNRERSVHHQTVRAARLTGGYVRSDIFERDGWICQICFEEVPRFALTRNHPLEPTIDHVIQLCLGGLDVRENVRLAHRICNTRRPRR